MARSLFAVLFAFCLYLAAECHVQENTVLGYDLRFARKHVFQRKHFDRFVLEHNKTYSSLYEREKRFAIFQRNLKKIDYMNRNEQGTAKYGATKFADMTAKEFSMYTGLKPVLANEEVLADARVPEVQDETLPESFDWRDQDAVTPVKDQGFCGSCWAFSTTGNIEGQYKVRRGQLISLSEQELVDCDKLDEGCGGGYMTNAYKSIMDMGGLETEKDYPYAGYLSDKCVYNKTLAKVNIDSYVSLPTNETQLAQWLVKHGPISIGINAAAMQFYMKGIAHPWKWICSPKKIDHGVLIVGFGHGKGRLSKKDMPYWIVKNSWGTSWGRKGYYYVYRGDGTCGVNTMATSAWINPK
ncbi:putative cysteine proteinase [Halotydeus destructor]|nr:putative cysteine proteinase [Halotydeus destructor]